MILRHEPRPAIHQSLAYSTIGLPGEAIEILLIVRRFRYREIADAKLGEPL
jgi:hypothetical protein